MRSSGQPAPSIPTTGTKIYLHYGNPYASSLSDGAATFLFFDHFVGTAVNTTRWTKSGDVTVAGSVATLNAPDERLTSVPVFGVNTVLATRASINTAVWGLVGFGDDNNLAAIYANYPYSNSLNAINRLNSPSTQSSLTFLSGSGWNVLEIRRTPASTIYVVDVHGSISQYLLTGPAPFILGLRAPARISSWTGSSSGTLFPASPVILLGVLRTRIRFHHLLLFQQILYRAIPPSPFNLLIGHPAHPLPGALVVW